MTISLNLSRDYLVVNDTAIVSYAVKLSEAYPRSATYASPVAISYVLQREITKEDVLETPALLQGDKGRFHLWTANLISAGNIKPKIGDQLTDQSGIIWIVKAVDLLDMDGTGIYQRWLLKCLKAVA